MAGEDELTVPEKVASTQTETFVLIIFAIIGAAVLVADLILLLLTMKTQRQRMVRNSFSSMDQSAMQGAAMLVVAVIMMSLRDIHVSDNVLLILCYTKTVLLVTGITNCMAALLMKSSAVYYHFQSKPKPIKNWMPCLGIVALLIIDAALCIARAIRNPYELELVDSMKTCKTDNNTYWTIGFLVYKGFILLFAVLMGVAAMFSTKHIKTDLKYVTVASLLNSLLFIVGVVLMFGFTMTPLVTEIIHGALILAGALQTIIFLILAKVESYKLYGKSKNTETDVSTGHVYHNPSLDGSELSIEHTGAPSESYQSSGNYENTSM